MSKLTRRAFGKSAALAGAATALSYSRVLGAADRIRVGFIGLGNRGDQVLDAFLVHKDCDVVGICDIYQPYLDFAAKKIGTDPRQTHEYRHLLDDKAIDAVAINTPDHWHALQMIQACQAGKDVYVEKPLSLRVAEGRKMVQAAEKHKRVVQVGLMRRSDPFCREAAELIRKGGIGHVVAARAFHVQNEFPKGIGNPPNEAPPKDLDWEAWLGPAPKVPYNKNRTFYRFRWFYDYSGGQLTNFGVHYLDMIHWALGHNAPLAVTAMGGKYAIKDNREVPDTMEVLWTYPGNTLVSFTQINTNAGAIAQPKAEIVFHGTKGTLYLFGGGYEVVPDTLPAREFPALSPLTREQDRNWKAGKKEIEAVRRTGAKNPTPFHARNFLDCVRSRQQCNCDIETGHRDTTAPLLGNIAHRLRAYLEWDAKAEQFTNNSAANKYLQVQYRKPYELPS